MNKSELEQLLFQHTENEKKYAIHNASLSNRYTTAQTISIDNQELMYFHLDTLDKNKIMIRKDSRYIEMPLYTYSSVNINYIYSGKCTYLIDGKKLTLHKGDVCIFDKGVARSKERTSYEDIIININISDAFLQKSIPKSEHQNIISAFLLNHLMTDSSHDNYIVFQTNGDTKIVDLFDRVLIEYFENRPYSKEIIQNYLSIIIMELLLLYQTRKDIHMIHLPSQSYNIILEILFYIENNYATCTLKEVAEHFGYHEKYLCTYIKKYSGKSFHDIKRDCRLKESIHYLLNTQIPITEICEKVGYSNRNQFYKEFKAAYHVLPKEYRKRFSEILVC